uniref:OTU domain-containing protein 3 n=1 Tax=Lepisosteus oculatus TaxID=7918 RepID=W5MLV9_LEPOC|nr:PREDICTED: OTU domain-containing protein 3 [Lepisosteus oculatus]XP_015192783.1 PREDICTED: OTU domain-containing protein 3 [Lepisosteus oculatus]
MSRKQSAKAGRGNRKCDVERKRDERAARRALAKDRKNRPPGEEQGEEFVSFSNQLQVLGLKLREVPGDGNCLFRALGDQLEGHSRGHLRLRCETVEFMEKHRDDFEPFVEDDIPFAQHMANLAQPGTFAGNDAIVAFARSQQVRVVIHQLNAPLWQINGSEKPVCRELHIAYRYGDHYDSVRRIGDNSETPAQLRTETLRSGGHHESPDSRAAGNTDRPADSYRTSSTDSGLILRSLASYSPTGRVENCSDLSAEAPPCPVEWEESEPETHSCPGLWEESGTGTRLFGPMVQTDHMNSKPPAGDGTVHSRTAKVSNRQRKEQQRLEKKRRQEERHRQKILESRAAQNQDQNLNPPSSVTLVRALNTLSI